MTGRHREVKRHAQSHTARSSEVRISTIFLTVDQWSEAGDPWVSTSLKEFVRELN